MDTLTDIGHLIEGVVEQDPLTNRYVIKVQESKTACSQFDVQETLAKYVGQEVRLTLVSFAVLEQLSEMVQSGELSLANSVLPSK